MDVDLTISAYLDDDLTAQEAAEFQSWLKASPANVEAFISRCELHWALDDLLSVSRIRREAEQHMGINAVLRNPDRRATAAELSNAMILPAITDDPESDLDDAPAVEPSPINLPAAGRVPSRHRNVRTGLAAAILLVAGSTLVIILYQLGIFGGHSPQPIAMGPSLDAIWSDPGAVAAAGTLVKTGVPQSLKSGCAELTSSNGLVVLLQGPATFTVEKPGVVSLMSGRLTASVPKPARGFTVNTPIAHVVDLGTEFGVSVEPSGQTDVQTFRGTVSLTSSTSPPSAPASLITAGLARRVIASGDITEVSANTTTFVRPQQFDDWKANGTPYQRWKAYSERLRSNPDLVAYYTFDKSDAAPERLLNRVSTTGTALDAELHGIDRIHERPRWTEGRWPQKGALAFDRDSHEFVTMKAPAGSVLDFSRGRQTAAPFTICAWFRLEDPHPQHSSMFLRGTGKARSPQFAAEIYPDSSIRASVGDVVATGPQARANGQWQQIAFVYDPIHGTLELYLDGALVAQRNDAPPQLPESSFPLGLGSRIGADYLPPVAGRIDEFAVFRRALSAEQVREMYQAGKPE